MPAYDLSPEQLQDVATFLLSLDFRGVKAVAKPVPEILKKTCAGQAEQASASNGK